MTRHMDDSSGETIARYQQLFEESQEAIVILTRESQVVDVNRAWLDLFGYEREEVVGTDAGRAGARKTFIVSKAIWTEAVPLRTMACG